MAKRTGLVVTVDGGDLPRELVERITAAVQTAVRQEVAASDVLRDFDEQSDVGRSIEFDGQTGGIAFIPPDDVTS